jgi:hypothetical protein
LHFKINIASLPAGTYPKKKKHMNKENLEYNTARDHLVIKEYGRNVQKLIHYSKTIEDRNERTRFCHFVVQVMGQMRPHYEGGDVKRKLWDHLHLIADMELEVDSPYPLPEPEAIFAKPDPLKYSDRSATFKQYGKNIEYIIEKTVELEDEEIKKLLVKIIGNHLKKLYLNWNRESVSDELINEHMKKLSGGKMEIPDDVTLNSTSDILAKTRKKKPVQQKNDHKGRKGGYQHSSKGQRSNNYYNK